MISVNGNEHDLNIDLGDLREFDAHVLTIRNNDELEFVCVLSKNAAGKTEMKIITDEVSEPPKIVTVVSE